MLYLLDATDPEESFPDPANAETDPDGLLAIGGDLTPTRLLNAYASGIFPWYNPGDPILWWSPDPRMVLFPDQLKISRSLNKTLRQNRYQVSIDQAFSDVISGCSEPRETQDGTWLSPGMISAYETLFQQGYAHSVEAWRDGDLVGGLYGVALGRVFFGESMFSRSRDASKVAFVHLVRTLSDAGFELIDCQVYTQHLESLGAQLIPLQVFLQELRMTAGKSTSAEWLPHPPRETER